MKKKIDILLLIAVLIFSFSFLLCWAREKNRQLPLQKYMENINARAEEQEDVSVSEAEPTVFLHIAQYLDESESQSDGKTENEYIFVSVVMQEMPELQELAVDFTYNPDVLQFNVYPESISRTQWSFQSVEVTELSPGVLRIACFEPCVKDWQSVFETLSFKVIGQLEPDFEVSLVACKDINGKDVDCFCNIRYGNEATQLLSEKHSEYTVPTVRVSVKEPSHKQKEPPADFGDAVYEGTNMQGHYNTCEMAFHVYQKDYRFENCELLITYNPDVLEYSMTRNVNLQDKLKDKVLRMEDSEIQLLISAGGSNYTDPITFNVIGNGNAELNVELLSYRDRSGVRADAQLVADVPEMELKTSDFYVDDMSVKDCLLLLVKKTVRFFCDVFQYGDLYG